MKRLKLPKKVRKFQMSIGGRSSLGGARDWIVRESPAHGKPVSTWPAGNERSVDLAVTTARKAFDSGQWSRVHCAQRSVVLHKVGDLIDANSEKLALVESLETGKPISQARAEMGGCANIWRFAAAAARTIRGESYNDLGEDLFGLTIRQPVGVVAAIIPWNFPLLVLSERLPFILAAGCTAVIKPSEQTSGTALMLAELLKKAGVPAGTVSFITGYGPDVGQPLLEHRDVNMASFTGSSEVGRIALQAAAGNIKRIGLELGGKNPFLVFADADVPAAADAAAFAMAFNAGQCCVAASRLVVHKSIADRFTSQLASNLRKIKVGETLDPRTQVGAIFERKHYDKIMGYIKASAESGSKIAVGGKRTGPRRGMFIAPTLITGARHNSPICRDEVFGPVMTVHTFRTYDEGIKLANDTNYGLAASIWSRNVNNCLRAYRSVDAGRIWINTVMEDGPETPLGGCKESGIGREAGVMGIEAYTEVKTANIKLADRDRWLS